MMGERVIQPMGVNAIDTEVSIDDPEIDVPSKLRWAN